jgi:hypothetical protein
MRRRKKREVWRMTLGKTDGEMINFSSRDSAINIAFR